ncbi:MAG: CehA/McbA family metallohydrolase [Anaerolineaceae bacterium]|jgi:hypothetical protein|nr:CehA/McbA family metallohydrolase [Anaerolineaceae bacterium]
MINSSDDLFPCVRKENCSILLDETKHISVSPRIHYIDYSVVVPPNASKVGLVLSFHKEKLAQLFVSLHDPDGFRGNRMKPGGKGDIALELWVSPDEASEGGVPGAIPAGEWRAQIDIERLGEDVDCRLVMYAEFDPVQPAVQLDYPQVVVRPEPGWYKGELHCHSTESDGKYPVATVVQAAVDAGLDFLSLTDHFTNSQWWKLAKLKQQRQIALIRSLEITSHQGHANLHGLNEWVDVYVDRPDWSMNQAADAVHDQQGLFCINHPFSSDLAWRSFDFQWERADLMEIYHNLEGANNHFHPGLWDLLLNQGHRIIGVGGTDSHDPFTGTDRLNQVVTWVYADELSEAGIIAGLRSGRVYISRGPELRFTARNAKGQTVQMGESIKTEGEPVSLDLQIKSEEPLRLFVFRDGLLFDTDLVEPGSGEWTKWTVVDHHPAETGYYRVELHQVYKNPKHPGIEWRDYTTTRLISNPVWVK